MKIYKVGLMLLVSVLAAACSNNSGAVELTLVSQNVDLATQIADIRATATVDTDRLRVTAVFVETALAQSRVQNQRLSATIEALGGNAALVAPAAGSATLDAGGAASDAMAAGGVPPAAGEAGAVTATPGVPALYNVVTARGVGANDCALAPLASFSTTDPSIYVVATAANIAPGTMLASRWYLEGSEVIAHDFTPDFAIDQNCVWFFIDSTEVAFTPGNWTVQLEINGLPAGEPAAFTISG